MTCPDMHPARNSFQAMVHILFVGLIITLSISSSHAASGTVQCTTRFLTSGAGGGVPQGLAECGDGKQRRICEIHSCRASSASGRRPLYSLTFSGCTGQSGASVGPVHLVGFETSIFGDHLVAYVPEASPPHRVMRYLCPLHQSYYPVCTACRV
ncbi:hypothetical protein H4Q26_011399 [Puccinia striiformis f. sp. tritici PST-130]|nr:hypothetical protein Pst134EB_020028 [Puccinia striiformis f. sp. tritici]KAI9615460.1 hypothetical protein H4Q26_011399 [Puccinia striiformis f. sp. tritici PST-130]